MLLELVMLLILLMVSMFLMLSIAPWSPTSLLVVADGEINKQVNKRVAGVAWVWAVVGFAYGLHVVDGKINRQEIKGVADVDVLPVSDVVMGPHLSSRSQLCGYPLNKNK